MGADIASAAQALHATIAGMFCITLDQHAFALGAQLPFINGSFCSLIVHSSRIAAFQQDLSDPTQPRFTELADSLATRAITGSHSPAESWSPISSSQAAGRASEAFLAELKLSSPPEASHHVESIVLGVMVELTGGGVASDAISASTPFMEAGIDSFAATELASRLKSLTGVPLAPTLVFDHPTPRSVALHILEEVSGLHPPTPCAELGSVALEPAVTNMITAIGQTGRWPGGTFEQYEHLQIVRGCGDAITSVPVYSRWMLEDVNQVEASRFCRRSY